MDGLHVFLADDSGSVAAGYALLVPFIGAVLGLALCRAMLSLRNLQNRSAVKASVRRRRYWTTN